MNENLNLKEILKGCPAGTKLYSTIYGCVYFDYIDLSCEYSIILKTLEGIRVDVSSDGLHYLDYDGECTLFPSKDQRDWSKWHRPFVDGDIIFTYIKGVLYDNKWLSIFRRTIDNRCETYVDMNISDRDFYIGEDESKYFCNLSEIKYQRLATDEEKKLLFDTVRKRGYRWNEETKTLEELPDSEFKDGDIIFSQLEDKWVSIFKGYNNERCNTYVDLNIEKNMFFDDTQYLCDNYKIKEQRLATEEEKEHLFDVIREKGYTWNADTKTLKKIHKDRFKPFMLKPFNKVLVRNVNNEYWKINLFGSYLKGYTSPFLCVGKEGYRQCIPYEGNEHLLGTTNDCTDFFKIWED